MKKGLESVTRASSRSASKPLFQFASQTRTALPSGLPLGCRVRWFPPFRCGETSGVFPQEKRRSPAGATMQAIQAGRSRSTGSRPRSGQEKRQKFEGRACSHIRIFCLFSYSLPKQVNPKTGFRGGSRGAFTLKAAPRTSPHPPPCKKARKENSFRAPCVVNYSAAIFL